MFLNTLKRRNKKLVQAAFDLHQKGYITPDSYMIDVDIFLENSKKILQEANKYGIKLYYMLKQIGRNPYLAKKLEEMGYSGAVVVDFKEADIMIKNGLKIGNVGHLVQVPDNMLEKVIKSNPEIITVYSYEKAEKISEISERLNKIQDIMIKVVDDNSSIYPGQESGFEIKNLETEIEKLLNLKGIKINGITSFPCFLYNKEKNKIEPTENIKTIKMAQNILKEKFDISVEQLNMPSVTSVENIKQIKELGGTHGEPGHSLTGTTPLGEDMDIEELPAYVYISEISHQFRGKWYFYGGGYYRRGNLKKALVGEKIEKSFELLVDTMDSSSIDYYLSLKENQNTDIKVGDTVLTSFRTQIFVTRSDVVLVKGIQSAEPEIIGRYTALGEEMIYIG